MSFLKKKWQQFWASPLLANSPWWRVNTLKLNFMKSPSSSCWTNLFHFSADEVPQHFYSWSLPGNKSILKFKFGPFIFLFMAESRTYWNLRSNKTRIRQFFVCVLSIWAQHCRDHSSQIKPKKWKKSTTKHFEVQ